MGGLHQTQSSLGLRLLNCISPVSLVHYITEPGNSWKSPLAKCFPAISLSVYMQLWGHMPRPKAQSAFATEVSCEGKEDGESSSGSSDCLTVPYPGNQNLYELESWSLVSSGPRILVSSISGRLCCLPEYFELNFRLKRGDYP